MAAADKPLVWVLGDSHVHWLEKFVASSLGVSTRFIPGSLWEGMDHRVASHGYRGAMVAPMQQNRGLDQKFIAELPQIVVLSANGNDIYSGGQAPLTLWR